MNTTYSDYHYLDIADIVTHAAAPADFKANGPVYECTYEVTEEGLWLFGRDAMKSGNTDLLDFWDYRYIDGDITAVPSFLEGLYMITEDRFGQILALAKEGEEPLD